jgi:hypothetical protein
LDQGAYHIVVIQLLVQKVELRQEIDHINDIQKDFKHQWVVLLLIVGLEELNSSGQYVVVLSVALDQHVVVRLLHNEQDDLHKVEETQILMGLLVRQQDELHDVLNVVLVSDLLDVL